MEKDEKEEKEKKKEKEENKDKNKKEIDEGKSPKIIILDFSSSANNDENEEDLNKNLKKNKSKSKSKEKNKDNNNNNLNDIFNKKEENEFFVKKNKTKNDNDDDIIDKNKELNNNSKTEKLSSPKSKKSCLLVSKAYKINETHSFNRKLSAKYRTNCIIKSSTATKLEDLERNKNKKKRNTIDDFFNICASRHFNHNEDYQNKIINTKAIKENIRKRNKKKHKKNIDKLNSRKDSNKSCHNITNKKFRHIISHNYDKKNNNNFDKKLNINLINNNKISDTSTLSHTPKNLGYKKEIYASNRNLTNIKITSHAVENKDIHLEMNGKQETIINYTNQEMVDDENEYMVECFKILLKLDKSKQPRCKNKVNFNFENSPTEKNKKKIALFDLDETLVHCTKEKKGLNGDSINIKLPTNKIVNVGLNIRPHWKEALDLIKSHYHIVIYTASHQSYADAVLDYLDKDNKYFQYRLYRNHCVQCDIDGIKFYVKDLDTLTDKYNLKDVVLIDNSVLSFAYHLNNGIPIVPYIEQKEDSQLLMLAYYLVSIANFDDLTEENKKHINIEHFILEVKDLENEESEENDEENEENNKNNNDNNNGNDKENNDIINKNEDNFESKNEDNNDNNNNDNNDNNSLEKEKNNEKNICKINNPVNNNYNRRGIKLNSRKSEKALKIANDMKQNMAGIYNKNYN